MATPPITLPRQDMPPKGGYPTIDWKRGARPRGPSGAAIWGGIIGLTVFGFYNISKTNAERRMCHKEQREARMAIMPFLMAEADTMRHIEQKKLLAHEREIMKNVEGWKVGESVYSKGYAKPTHGIST